MIRFILAFLLLSTGLAQSFAARLEFNREIRPLMADTCFRCHGFDAAARKGGLRLDVRADALKPAKSGAVPIVPGRPEASEVIRRLFTQDADDVMPPVELHKELTAAQKELFRRWIAEGAEYQGHWSFQVPVRPAIPEIRAASGEPVRHPIDAFIRATLAQKGLQSAPEADRVTLIRRLTQDLTGLPPTPAAVDAFLSDSSPQAYERVVDPLLNSPRFGERMAQDWLDAARFADSNGYQVDRDREMWAWRDWVVSAFNRNLPFDQFTVEQLAGDLLPGVTLEQRIATGFHRNHMINEEGGIIPEEFLAEYCADRVETTATVWLGLTFNCARCHDHKYDPITQRDFYGLYAFFHNVAEKGVGDYSVDSRHSAPPLVKLPAPELEAKLSLLNRELDDQSAALTNSTRIILAEPSRWEEQVRSATMAWKQGTLLSGDAGTNGSTVVIEGNLLKFKPGQTNASTLTFTAKFPLSVLTACQFELTRLDAGSINSTNTVLINELRVFRAEGLATETNALSLRPRALDGSVAAEALAKALDKKTTTAWPGVFTTNSKVVASLDSLDPLRGSGHVQLRFELDFTIPEAPFPWQLLVRATSLPLDLLVSPDVQSILQKGSEDRKEDERKKLDEFRLAQSLVHTTTRQKVEQLRKQVQDTDNSIPVTLVMSELEQPRETFILMRGAYDKKGDQVQPNTPGSLPAFPSDFPRNRLGLARWLTGSANPLTARVIVNRLWQSLFGIGIVRSAEDFGIQGEWPSHPDLLDWLATEFVRSGWDVKAILRLMVTSATYRQDSRSTEALRAVDPENRWLARGPRWRLSAEAIRDQALAVSGLLVGQLGGPSVKPYHPPGLYEQVVAGSSAETYVQDKGLSLYRRTLYTYWKRSVPNPALLLFDRPFRETCAVRRARTTTPLQALNLLNDPTFVEAARALAQRMIRDGGLSVESRLGYGFRLVTARWPRPAELVVLSAGLRRAERSFQTDPSGAGELVNVGESSRAPDMDLVALAAYTTIASTILNLDETVTKE